MTTRTIRMSEIECDQCGVIQRVRKQRKPEEAFAHYGWDIGKGNVADLCPECAHIDLED